MKPDWKTELKPQKNPTPLNEREIKEMLDELKNWKIETNPDSRITKLVREIKFDDFIEAFAYLSKIAMISQMLDHHAEIFNVYNQVKISLYTHTSLKITSLDRIFAFNAEACI
jgi:4a-hydroxytetrahydrobiopterin dehydratase